MHMPCLTSQKFFEVFTQPLHAPIRHTSLWPAFMAVALRALKSAGAGCPAVQDLRHQHLL